jgi:hypothetical protein
LTLLSYFQWESEEAFESFRADEETMGRVKTVSGPEPRVYEIVYTITA